MLRESFIPLPSWAELPKAVLSLASQVVQWLKKICLPVQEMQETWVWLLDQEDPLEEEMTPTPVFLPGKFYGQRSLAGYSPWGQMEVFGSLE